MSTMQNIPPYRILALAIAFTSGTGITVTSAAQDDRQTSGLEEIVVSAQRRETSLQDTPIAITAFSASKLEALGVFDVSQLGGFAPNMTIAKQPSSNTNMGVAIRGVGLGETQLAADPKVGLYIDGILNSKTIGGVFDVVDMERVEVLRGPQGTLFGRNTTGGAINITTLKPSGELRGKAMASVGNFGYLRYGGSLDLPAIGSLATKVSYSHSETDGWARNHYTGVAQPPQMPYDKVERNLASKDDDAFRVALRWAPREDLTLDYAFDKTDNAGVAPPFQLLKVKDHIFNGFTRTSFDFKTFGGELYQQMAQNVQSRNHRQEDFVLDEMTEETLKIKAHTFVAAWELSNNLTLKYLYGSRKSEQNNGADLDGGAYVARDLFYGVFAGNPGRIQTPGYHSAVVDGRIELDTHEIQILGSAFEDRLHYTGGIFMYEEDVSEIGPQTFSMPIAFVATRGASTPVLGPLYNAAGFCPAAYGGALCIGSQRLPIPGASDPGIPGVVDFAYGQNSTSRAIYGQATYALTDVLDLTLGIRYTEDDKKAWMYNQNMLAERPTLSPGNPLRVKGDWDNISYLANISYAFSDDILAYLTYTTGYNGGGFSTRATKAASFQTPYDEEEIKATELGLKSELFERRLRLNIAIFNNEFTDIQISQFVAGAGGAASQTANAGTATIRGIEFDAVAIPLDGLTIDFSYGYLDAKFNKFMERNPATNMLEDISSIMTMKYAPKNTAVLGVQYDFQPFSFGALSVRFDMNYQDSMVFHTYANQWDYANERTLINARISLRDVELGCCNGDGKLSVSLWGKNLSDKEYINWGIDFGSLGFAGAVYGEPRTYGLDFVYTYK